MYPSAFFLTYSNLLSTCSVLSSFAEDSNDFPWDNRSKVSNVISKPRVANWFGKILFLALKSFSKIAASGEVDSIVIDPEVDIEKTFFYFVKGFSKIDNSNFNKLKWYSIRINFRTSI